VIKDMLAILRVIENPTDQISWYRLLQLLEGIGPVTAKKIIECLNQDVRKNPVTESADVSGALAMPLYNLLNHPPSVPAAAREDFACA